MTKIIEKDTDLKVVATARNGMDAIQKVSAMDLDVITMDVNMPEMNGIEALKVIKSKHSVPVLMISALTHEGAEETLDALNHGAFDFIAKPSGAVSLDMAVQGEIIRQKIRTAARSKRYKTPEKQPLITPKVKPLAVPSPVDVEVLKNWSIGKVIGIGVSTGGPKTLMRLLPEMPANFNGVIIIAQHMPENFTLSFAKRLDSICPLKVKEAEDGEIIQPGHIYIAKGGRHTIIKSRGQRVFLIETQEEVEGKIYKPSVDVLFDSLSECFGKHWLGIMLTGMGQDGSEALTNLKKSGGQTIVESEESCVVYGMPGKVVELGGASFILHERDIMDKVKQIVGI